MVELRDVRMQFEDKKVLDGFSLKVEPQERLVIMGQSGSGKSTILRLILGTLRPNSAVNAAPMRAASMIPVMSGPSSRVKLIATRPGINRSVPNRCN